MMRGSFLLLASFVVGALLVTTEVLLRSKSPFKNHPLRTAPENPQEGQQPPLPEENSASVAFTEDTSTSIAEQQRHRDLFLFVFDVACTDAKLTACNDVLKRKKELCGGTTTDRDRELLGTWPWGFPFASCSEADLQGCFDEYFGIECDPADPDDVDLSRGSVSYCPTAQLVISRTSLPEDIVVDNVEHATFNAFKASTVTPNEESPNAQVWQTQQFVSTSSVGGTDYEQTISCKMKSGNALNQFFAPEQLGGGIAIDLDCALLAESFVLATLVNVTGPSLSLVENAVYSVWATLTEDEFYESETASAPAPVAYLNGGRLNIVSKQYFVDRFNDDVPNEVRGIEYCQFIAPEYVLKIVEGAVTPPTCTGPPAYEPDKFWLFALWDWLVSLIFGPPDPTVWACENP